MKKPFAKADPPKSYAEGPRLVRAVQLLSQEEQARFWGCYREHLEKGRFESIQRQGSLIRLALGDEKMPDVFEFGAEVNAQRFLSALTDCLRSSGVAVKVLMPLPNP